VIIKKERGRLVYYDLFFLVNIMEQRNKSDLERAIEMAVMYRSKYRIVLAGLAIQTFIMLAS
jgi:hypothetical protein